MAAESDGRDSSVRGERRARRALAAARQDGGRDGEIESTLEAERFLQVAREERAWRNPKLRLVDVGSVDSEHLVDAEGEEDLQPGTGSAADVDDRARSDTLEDPWSDDACGALCARGLPAEIVRIEVVRRVRCHCPGEGRDSRRLCSHSAQAKPVRPRSTATTGAN